MKNVKLQLLLLLLFSAFRTLAQPYQQPMGGYEEGVIYLKIVDSSNFEINYPPPTNYSGSNADIYVTFADFGVTEVVKPFELLGGTKFLRIYKVYFTQSGQVANFMAQLNSYGVVEYTEQVPEKETYLTFPDDPSVPIGSYQLGLINAYDAFDLHTGGGSLVAIVDDAVQVSHEDLEANIALGWDAADLDNDPNPPFTGNNAALPTRFSHGTHVAGIAGAVTDNQIGVASIGWNNELMAIKTVRDNAPNTRNITHGYEGIAWATANGADVINLSWGGTAFSQAEYDVVFAARQSGAIIVAAVGNNLSAQPRYPAAYGEGTTGELWEEPDGRLVIAVASIDADGDQSDWGPGPFGPTGSNFGPWVDVAAYGTGILSTLAGSASGGPDNNNYGIQNGTSMAAPLVAGLAGLMASYNPAASPEEIIACLLGTANNDIYGPAHPGNLPGTLGTGRIDAFAALRCLATDCQDDPVAIITPSSLFICQGDNVQLTANEGIAYLWSTGATTQSITINQAGTYVVTVTFAGNCTSTASIDIQQAITEATVVVTENSGNQPGDGILCGQGFLNLTAFWGLGYQWSAFNATTQSIGPINAGVNLPFTWNYAVTVTGVGGCPGVTDVVTGTAVWLLPPVAAITVDENSQTPDDGVICNGQSAVLTASGAGNYAWSTGATTASITVSPTVTTTYSVTVSDVSDCEDEEEFEVVVIECPLSQFTCPCTAPHTLNIDAAETGSLYSQLEAQFNFDQNNDGVIDLDEHNGCIAISGRLIIDQNLVITDCPNIQMQPCAEIVVQEQRHLTMTQNTITGCERMWRGITVEPLGWLTFQNNTVEDAQQAITANGSFFSWPPASPVAVTTLEVQRNRFVRNHIGVMATGPTFANLQHQPFTRNNYIGNGTQPLLPSCDPGLANWNADHGYAGVVSRNLNLSVGASTDVGFSNTFSALRNGVMGENGWLQVHHASFTDMVGEWVLENQMPTFASSFGMGVLVNPGPCTVNNSFFNGCGHGIYSNNGGLTAIRNNMPRVRRGIEIINPFSCELSENEDIVYLNKGIIGRELQTGPLSQLLQYAINKNTLRNFDATTTEAGDMAIEIRNANQPDLFNARISENNIFLDANDNGIFIRGTGRWTIDRNYIQYRPFGITSPAGLAMGLNASARNYFFSNTVEDITTAPLSRAFNIANSPENTFCCNITDGNRLGFRFFGACGATAFRTSDMTAHQTCLEISQAGTIGEQGPLNPASLTFPNHRNRFNTTSGTALHLGINQVVIGTSRFHVLSNLTPDFPEVVATPNAIPLNPWFDDDGIGNPACESCVEPPMVPDARLRQIDEGDRIVAGIGFGTATPGERMLQWEGRRSLYHRMREFPADLYGKEGSIDAFYTNAVSGKIGGYYNADSLVNDLSVFNHRTAAAIQQAMGQIEEAEAAIHSKLENLPTVQTWADSLAIYRQADSILANSTPMVQYLIQLIETAQIERNTKAQNALPVILALSAADVLEQNRKDVLAIYAQTIGLGIQQLTPEQAAVVSAVAHQCPEEGGSAVYLAQAIYQLIEPKQFDDEVLCQIGERSSPQSTDSALGLGYSLVPNPAWNTVSVIPPQNRWGADTRILLLNASGQVVLETSAAAEAGATTLWLNKLPEGIYFCRIYIGDTMPVTRKLVINR